MGRKSKWIEVKKHLDNGDIKKWSREYTESQISSLCGVGTSSFNEYKRKHPELREALQEGKQLLIGDLKESLIKKAKGYTIEESKTVTKIDKDGNTITETQVYNKHFPADTGAIHLLLKNLDNNWHNDDMVIIKMKQEELELKKQLSQKEEQIVTLTSQLQDLLDYTGSGKIE